MTAYYNEFDPKAAAWLRELIRRGLIADGVVDERSILEVQPEDLRGFTQVHCFAGIGGWSYALRLAGWPDDRPVWTGSPPCQPFSSAGARKGKDDERHLAPHFIDLVRACRPGVLFGEQVASAAVFGKAAKGARASAGGEPDWAWFDDLSDRLEAARYTIGASDIPAAGVGAPHIRQRTFFGAIAKEGLDHAASARHVTARVGAENETRNEAWLRESERRCTDDRLADTERGAAERHGQQLGEAPRGVQSPSRQQRLRADPRDVLDAERLAHAHDTGSQGRAGMSERPGERAARAAGLDGGLADAGRDEPRGELGHGEEAARVSKEQCEPVDGPAISGGCSEGDDGCRIHGSDGLSSDPAWPRTPDSPWRAADWLFCRDGKWRPVEPGTQPLAHGIPARVVRLRGYGNAIVPQAAAVFIRSFREALEDARPVRVMSEMQIDKTEAFG